MSQYYINLMKMRLANVEHMINAEVIFNLYVQGIIDGIEAHAVNKDGRLVVGTLERPFQEVKSDILQIAREVQRELL